MEWTPTPMMDKDSTDKTPLRHSQEITQPAISHLTELYTQSRERRDNEEELITEFMAQYQLTGECCMAHIIDAAQLTHPISSTEDADMQPNAATSRPDTHDIATPRRSIGGRCRKWVVSTQDPALSNKRTCAACTICSTQFAPGEPRLQQWGCRDNDHTYMLNASKAASRPAMSSSLRIPQTLKRGTPSCA